jgi:Tol biopolymer transport system component
MEVYLVKEENEMVISNRVTKWISVVIVLLLMPACACDVDFGQRPSVPGGEQPAVGNSAKGKIAFCSGDSIHIINPDRTNEIRLVEGYCPIWSPGGKKIAYISTSKDELYVINIDGTGKTKVASSSEVGGLFDWGLFSWSPDGKKILISSERGYGDVYVVNADGSNMIKLAEGRSKNAIFSPDGRKIAYILEEPLSDDCYLYVMNSDGTGKSRLIEDKVGVELSGGAALTWSPDGEKIAYNGVEGIVVNIYVVSADGGNKIMLEYNAFFPSWSPNGERIAYVVVSPFAPNSYSYSLYVANPDGTSKAKVAEAGHNCCIGWPSWSPDGKKIVFAIMCTDQEGVYVVNSDGSGLARLVSRGFSPQWSPK